jgi:hypothetical protein
MIIENWKDVVGYEGLYQVSDLGRVKSLKYGKERILTLLSETYGHCHVLLYHRRIPKKLRVHRLVYSAFVGEIGDLFIDHINGMPSDNRLVNLRKCTPRENSTFDNVKRKRSSMYVGVSWDKQRGKWYAKLNIKEKQVPLGRFVNEIDAHNAYQNAIKQLV